MSTSAPILTIRQLNRATLARQMLLSRETTGAVAAVERLAGLQAQLARPPFAGLWTRIEGFRREDLLRPLRERQILRATAMRGTLHLISASDYVALRGALQPMLTRGMQAILRERAQNLDIDALQDEARAFFGGKPATFDALRDHLKAKHPEADERAMAYAIRMHLPLVQVPTDDPWGFPAAADFALADDWLGKKVPTGEAPAHTLVRRYLAAFGPATPRDAQVWSGLQSLRAAFEELRPELVTFRDERKRELFDLPDAPRPDEDSPAPVRFLPEFDNLVLAHDDRTRVIADEHRPRVTLKNLQVRATFLVDGFVAGTWKVERKRKTAALVLEPFGKLTKKTLAELEREGEALLRFVEEDAVETAVRVASSGGMTHPRAALGLLVLLTACAGQPDPGNRPHGSLLLRDVALIDGTGAPPREHVSVRVRSGIIEEIGEALEPRGARVVEGRGRFLIPGLWDAHVHLSVADEATLGVLVANGVTSVRDMGGELDLLDGWRARIERGELIGPRIFRAGPTVDGPKPGVPFRLTIANPEEGRAAVSRLKGLGVDFIKIHNAVPRDAFFALAAEAQRQGLPFAGHVPMTVQPAEAAEAGQRSVEHIATLIEGTYSARFPDETAAFEAMPQWLEDELPAIAETFARHGTWFVPTIVAYELRARRGELADHPDPRSRYATPPLKQYWDKAFPLTPRDRAPENIARRTQFVEIGKGMIRRMHEAGVGIAVGSDLAGRDVLPGFSVHDEIALLVASGLTPMEALRAGTSEAARLLDVAGTLGTIAPGKAADLVLLDGDPLADVRNVGRISAVVLRGRFLERADLERLLEAAAR